MRLAAKLADRRMKTFWRRVCTFSFHHTVNTAESSLRRGECLSSPWVVLAGIFSLYSLHTVAAGLGSGRGCGPALWPSPHLCSSSFSILVFMPFFSLSLPLLILPHDIDTCPGHTHCFPLSHLLLYFYLRALFPLFFKKKYFHLFIFGHSESLGAISELCFLKKISDTNTTL